MISLIAIIGRNRELGKENKLLTHIPGELPRFKRITTGHPIIMGRKTFESIGRPLPNRTNIIITRDKTFDPHKFSSSEKCDVFVVHSLDDALEWARSKPGDDEVFIIGGGQIFEQSISLAGRIYLTVIDADFPDADVYFPDYSLFSKIVEKEEHKSDKYYYKFITLEK